MRRSPARCLRRVRGVRLSGFSVSSTLEFQDVERNQDREVLRNDATRNWKGLPRPRLHALAQGSYYSSRVPILLVQPESIRAQSGC
jgi:hypothetical protein